MSGDVEFILNGTRYTLDAESVRTAIRSHAPDEVCEHWVDVDGVHWPPKQVLALATDLDRGVFTSHTALRQLHRLGFPTSAWKTSGTPLARASGAPAIPVIREPVLSDPSERDTAQAAFGTLLDFLATGLTDRIRSTESALDGADRGTAGTVLTDSGMTAELLTAALLVRRHAGRLNDVVHAAPIVQLLPALLEPGERVRVRPSLAAGNDPGRPFDLETDLRIAEF